MRYSNLFLIVALFASSVLAAPKPSSVPTPALQRSASSFHTPDFVTIQLWDIPDMLDLSRRDMYYELTNSGTASIKSGVQSNNKSEFERQGTFDVRLLARLGALLKARGYDKFKDEYHPAPKTATMYDRARTILFFSLADSRLAAREKNYIYDYADSAPLAVWEFEAAVRGVIQQVQWNGPPLPPMKPKSGVRGIMSDQIVSDERQNENYIFATVVALSAKDKREVARTYSSDKGDFVLGLASAKYIIEIRLPVIGATAARRITHSIEVKKDVFTVVEARFPSQRVLP